MNVLLNSFEWKPVFLIDLCSSKTKYFTFILLFLHLDNTATVLTRRNGIRRQEKSFFYLPIFIVDSGSPSLSSTNTLTISVCDCDADGIAQTCNAEAYILPAGLSTGALIAILACVLTLLGKSSSYHYYFSFK